MTGIQDTGDGLTQEIHVSNARIKNSIVRWIKNSKREVFGNEITGKNIEFSSICSNDGIPVSAVIKNNAGTCVAITYTLKEDNLRTILAGDNKAKPGRAALPKKTSREIAIPA